MFSLISLVPNNFSWHLSMDLSWQSLLWIRHTIWHWNSLSDKLFGNDHKQNSWDPFSLHCHHAWRHKISFKFTVSSSVGCTLQSCTVNPFRPSLLPGIPIPLSHWNGLWSLPSLAPSLIRWELLLSWNLFISHSLCLSLCPSQFQFFTSHPFRNYSSCYSR